MTIIQVKTHKLYIIKKRSNNKVSFVEFILGNNQNNFQLHRFTRRENAAKSSRHIPSRKFLLPDKCSWTFRLSFKQYVENFSTSGKEGGGEKRLIESKSRSFLSCASSFCFFHFPSPKSNCNKPDYLLLLSTFCMCITKHVSMITYM